MSLPSLFFYIAPIIGLVTLLIGICAALRPQAMSVHFGIAASGSTLPYVISTGIRDVFIGLTILILFYMQSWTALGAINLCVGLVAIFDFILVLKYGNKNTSYIHLIGAVSVILYGAWLLVF